MLIIWLTGKLVYHKISILDPGHEGVHGYFIHCFTIGTSVRLFLIFQGAKLFKVVLYLVIRDILLFQYHRHL